MRLTLRLPFTPSWAFVEVGVWLHGPTKFLLCIGAWVHMGRCNGFWWFDNLQRRRSSEPRIVGDGVRTWPLEDDEMYDWDDFDDSYPPACSSPKGHRWVCRDDDEEISYCANCGADGNA